MEILQNVSLQPFNTFGVDATASYFAEVTTVDELLHVLQWYREQPSLDLVLLGGGSNFLPTKDLDALVLKMSLHGRKIDLNIDIPDKARVTAAAGENWNDFVEYCLAENLGGLENLILIPGNVGTSPIQNIGAYGVEIKDVLENCEVLDTQTAEIRTLQNAECKFGYRDSIFKNEAKGRYIILSVTFLLTKENHVLHAEYGAIRAELEKAGITQPTIHDIAAAVRSIRQSKLPDPALLPNAGSFFKNPVIPLEQYEPLKRLHPEIPGYSDGATVKVPAGWLIEKAGWKGKTEGNVAVHELQALVLVNKSGKASGEEIYQFSQRIIDDIHTKFGIDLEREVNIL